MANLNTVDKDRKMAFLELLRIAACFFVIVNHTVVGAFLPQPPGSKLWLILISCFFVSKTAVPIFLMISGTLLLGRVDSYHKCRQRVMRILAVIILFSMVYYLRSWYMTGLDFDLIEFFKLIYQRNITNAYWYLYLYLGILVMLPLMQRMANGMQKREHQYLLLVTVLFFGLMPVVIHYWEGYCYSASFSVPFLSVYIGILFFGYYLANYVEVKWYYAVASAFVFVGCIGFLVAATYVESIRTPDNYLFYDDRTLLPVTLAGGAFFYLARWLGENFKCAVFWKAVVFFGGCSFGIYLLSDLFIDIYMNVYNVMMYRSSILKGLLAYQVLIFFSGVILTAVMKQIPYLKKLL